VLYSDIASSTKLVDGFKPEFAAEIYKSFLHCAAKLIRNEGGVITAYDGDRIMAVFIGTSKNTSAAKAALRINWAQTKVINPAIESQYPKTTFRLQHITAVDTSSLFVARTGVRGANDLVWVGRAANHAAKMAALSPDYPSRITAEIYDNMHASAKTSSDGRSMWEQATWTDMNRTIYRSTWHWAP
jgi:class 3 adenylate cyclase